MAALRAVDLLPLSERAAYLNFLDRWKRLRAHDSVAIPLSPNAGPVDETGRSLTAQVTYLKRLSLLKETEWSAPGFCHS